jgi:hypothetical protein
MGSWRNNLMISDDSDATSDANYKADKTRADIITTQNLLISINYLDLRQEASVEV